MGNRHIFIVGGARSGKSSHGITLAMSLARGPLPHSMQGEGVAYIATAQPLDKEMQARILRHKAWRPAGMTTIEEPVELHKALKGAEKNHDCIVIDCLTLWLTNIWERKGMESRIKAFLDALRTSKKRVIVISNEVGMGIVPAYKKGRRFRDALGELNRKVASGSDKVIFMVSGVPVLIKKRRGR